MLSFSQLISSPGKGRVVLGPSAANINPVDTPNMDHSRQPFQGKSRLKKSWTKHQVI